MTPTVTQQLEAMRTTMERVVLPALPADAKFALEGAALVHATLNWLVDVHESEFRYELDEAADYRRLLGQLAELGAVDAALLAEAPAGADGDLGAVRAQSRRLKEAAVTAALDVGGAARGLLLDVADRQSAREQAWFRMTGFTSTDKAGGIAEVLASS
ncbi:MAG: hypothetical protein JWM64_676 [Frankiales bacterium]|nr:hypothetical protein [Frankiales bacterium]